MRLLLAAILVAAAVEPSWLAVTEATTKAIDSTLSSCECTTSDPGICECVCTHVTDWDAALSKVPSALWLCENFHFELRDGAYFAIPGDLFKKLRKGTDFRMTLSNVIFQHIVDPTAKSSPFSDLAYHERVEIFISNVSVQGDWNWAGLENLSATSGRLNIVTTPLPELTSDFSLVCGGCLINVTITGCTLRSLGEGVFSSFRNLEWLSLHDNRIRGLKRSMFPFPAPKLRLLDLRNNLLTYLPNDMFVEMPVLTVIGIDGNEILAQTQVFRHLLPNLLSSNTKGWKWNCDCDLLELGSDLDILCDSPHHVSGRRLQNLTADDLSC